MNNTVIIGRKLEERIKKGENRTTILSDSFDLSKFKNHELNNVGKISLVVIFDDIQKETTYEMSLLDLVVYVTKDDDTGLFTRRVFNPFEKV